MNLLHVSIDQGILSQYGSLDYEIRPVRTKRDYLAYFSLRYEVWKRLNYIPRARECDRSRLEVDFADRTATALGMFHQRSGELIGCGRLVQSFGREIPRSNIELIEGLLREHAERTGEAQLVANFKRPAGLQHPYDMLKGFVAFKRFYKGLAERRITHAELGRIIVHPAHRGQRLGERIVEKLIDVAADNNIGVLFLACLAEHEHFYAKSGFQPLKGLQCERFVNVGVPAIAMARVLDRQAATGLAEFF